jgi:hypothetical protein
LKMSWTFLNSSEYSSWFYDGVNTGGTPWDVWGVAFLGEFDGVAVYY